MDWRHILDDQPLGDFSRDKAVYRIQHGRFGGTGQEGGIVTAQVAQKVVDLLVAAQAIREAGPARPLLRRTEDRAEQGLHTLGPEQHPRRAGREVAPIDGGVSFIEIIGANDDGKRWTVLAHGHAHGVKRPGEVAVITGDRHLRGPQAFLGPAGRSAHRGPERRPTPFHRVLA